MRGQNQKSMVCTYLNNKLNKYLLIIMFIFIGKPLNSDIITAATAKKSELSFQNEMV